MTVETREKSFDLNIVLVLQSSDIENIFLFYFWLHIESQKELAVHSFRTHSSPSAVQLHGGFHVEDFTFFHWIFMMHIEVSHLAPCSGLYKTVYVSPCRYRHCFVMEKNIFRAKLWVRNFCIAERPKEIVWISTFSSLRRFQNSEALTFNHEQIRTDQLFSYFIVIKSFKLLIDQTDLRIIGLSVCV